MATDSKSVAVLKPTDEKSLFFKTCIHKTYPHFLIAFGFSGEKRDPKSEITRLIIIPRTIIFAYRGFSPYRSAEILPSTPERGYASVGK